MENAPKEAEGRIGLSMPTVLRDFYREANGGHVSLVESSSGHFHSGMVFENLDRLVEETQLILDASKAPPAIAFINLYDGLHGAVSEEGRIVEVDFEYLARRHELPLIAASLGEFILRAFESACTRASFAYWLPD